ncbi:unnamed protein product, partial [marine sediment metagenome]
MVFSLWFIDKENRILVNGYYFRYRILIYLLITFFLTIYDIRYTKYENNGGEMFRSNNRKYNEIRPIKITRNYVKYAEGSTLMEMGDTKIICTASVEDKVPLFLRGTRQGWISAEYSMIPRANQIRNIRDSFKGKISGRSSEIQRLIGRSLRSVVDLMELGERTIWIDCDVVQADGGTRTSAIIGSFIALFDALNYLKAEGQIIDIPIKDYVGAISAGIVDG